MAEQDGPAPQGKAPNATAKAAAEAAAASSKQNPAFKMMGLPRLKLPSRNWMIFFSIVGGWAGAVYYDRREKKRIQKKWCDLVSHIAREPLETTRLPRRITVFLSAPPAEGLMSAREHFHEYVKPILVAAALDWDAVEGRREGDVRAELAEKIRRIRKQLGETSTEPLEEGIQLVIDEYRERAGIRAHGFPQGDIVIGRNTWKEYIRGLHEGWLGPLDPPASVKEALSDALKSESPAEQPPTESSDSPLAPTDEASPIADESATKPAEEKSPEEKPSEQEGTEKKKKRKQPPPFIPPSEYSTSSLSPNCPEEFSPSTIIPFPIILGFLNTPIRIYRFFTRRYLADDIGRATAAAVLAAYRPYDEFACSSSDEGVATTSHFQVDDSSPASQGANWEQKSLRQQEESEWHKSVRKREPDGKEHVWTDEMVLDSRIASRMRMFVLDAAEEARASRLAAGQEKPIGHPDDTSEEYPST